MNDPSWLRCPRLQAGENSPRTFETTAGDRRMLILQPSYRHQCMLRLFFVFVWLIVALAHAAHAEEENYRVVTLPSGKHVKVLGVGQINFSGSAPALMLKYETDLSIDSRAALDAEVSEIWLSFKADVEKAKLTSAIISANEKAAPGILVHSRGYNFVFSSGADGRWTKMGK